VVRVYYKMAKIGVFPSAFGRLHPVHRSPYIAIYLQTVFNVVVGIFCGITLGTVNTFGVLGAMITMGMIFVYTCGLVAVPVFYLREHRDEFNMLLHGILPALGVVALAPVLYYNLNPFPSWPFSLAPIIAFSWLGIGVIVVLWLSSTRPLALASAGREIFEED
jgi:amino acid transporter